MQFLDASVITWRVRRDGGQRFHMPCPRIHADEMFSGQRPRHTVVERRFIHPNLWRLGKIRYQRPRPKCPIAAKLPRASIWLLRELSMTPSYQHCGFRRRRGRQKAEQRQEKRQRDPNDGHRSVPPDGGKPSISAHIVISTSPVS